jgi:hypothetical protein
VIACLLNSRLCDGDGEEGEHLSAVEGRLTLITLDLTDLLAYLDRDEAQSADRGPLNPEDLLRSSQSESLSIKAAAVLQVDALFRMPLAWLGELYPLLHLLPAKQRMYVLARDGRMYVASLSEQAMMELSLSSPLPLPQGAQLRAARLEIDASSAGSRSCLFILCSPPMILRVGLPRDS